MSSRTRSLAESIIHHFNRLEMLDGRVNGISMAINTEYYKLGISFNAFTEVSVPSGNTLDYLLTEL